jgi:hypothetical protein
VNRPHAAPSQIGRGRNPWQGAAAKENTIMTEIPRADASGNLDPAECLEFTLHAITHADPSEGYEDDPEGCAVDVKKIERAAMRLKNARDAARVAAAARAALVRLRPLVRAKASVRAISAPPRTTPRAPRRPQTVAPRPAARVDSDDGPPAPPALLVSDRTALAVVGLTPRKFRTLVRERGIPSVKVGRRTLVRADDLLRALGLADPAAAAPVAPVWTLEDTVRALTTGTRKVLS